MSNNTKMNPDIDLDQIPWSANWLLKSCLPPEDRTTVLGDFYEGFSALAKSKSLPVARVWFQKQVYLSVFSLLHLRLKKSLIFRVFALALIGSVLMDFWSSVVGTFLYNFIWETFEPTTFTQQFSFFWIFQVSCLLLAGYAIGCLATLRKERIKLVCQTSVLLLSAFLILKPAFGLALETNHIPAFYVILLIIPIFPSIFLGAKVSLKLHMP